MARLCSICGRSGLSGHSRSHSNIATKRKQEINLQSLRVGNRRVKACTNCVRTEMKRLKGTSAV